MAVEVGRPSAADPEKAALLEEVQTAPASLSSLPPESPSRELFPTGRDQVPPGLEEAKLGEAAGLAEELLAVARRTAESAEVRYCPFAV